MPIRIGSPVPPPKQTPPKQTPPAARPKPKPAGRAPVQPRPDPSPAPRGAPGPAPAPRAHPKLKRRWVEARRDEGRKRLRILLAGAGVVAFLLGGVLASRSPLLDVDRVLVTGAEHTGNEAVVAAARLTGKPPMTEVSPAALRRRVARLPWVASVSATREWPGTVRIVVVERTAVATLPGGGQSWGLVDAEARVLAVAPVRPPGVPALSGVDPAGPPGSRLGAPAHPAVAVAAALVPPLRDRVVEVATVGEGTELRLAPHGVVRLGDSTLLAEKLHAAQTVLASVDPKVVKVLDVRVPRAPVLARR